MSPALLPAIIPLALVLTALFQRGRGAGGPVVEWIALGAMLVSLAGLPLAFLLEPSLLSHPWIRLTPMSALLVVLVASIGWLVLRYSNTCLAGEPRLGEYRRWLLLTLAAVNVVVLANHLLLLVAGWVGIGLALHRLLTFYPNRPRAALAAHKKFLFTRLSELLLLTAALLLYSHHGTFQLDSILAAYPAVALTATEQWAVALLALVALITCAQLPVHGWLIQVVEAPTPVSALLHAGVVNLGGYLLLLFSPLLEQAVPARWLLLMVAGATLVLASWIMLTRVSLKVRLAWSTSAQMALMLIECALGLYELALLHLVAHSCYKAHAFLNSGSAVFDHIRKSLAPVRQAPSIRQWVSAACFSTLAVAAVAMAFDSAWVSPWVLFGLALTQLLAERQPCRQSLPPFTLLALALVVAYGLQKWLFGNGFAAPASAVPVAADLWVALLWFVLFAGQWAWNWAPASPHRDRFHRWLFSGLYLDEWVTRITLDLWPTELPKRARAKHQPGTAGRNAA
ncbi:MAG: NADH-quinone oxidoreductase subunit L [Oleiphilaceae bacterium]|nr:NADH-quinone oxidoreductase subunit L [Oleiphilaceae bacterium]